MENWSIIASGAVSAARSAGRLIRRTRGPRGLHSFRRKGFNDFVTSVDIESQELLRRELGQVFPAAGFWGEEGVKLAGTLSRWMWVVDPLDGTTNFLHGYPHSAVSLALLRDSQVHLAVVHDPYRNETFRAISGQGAWLGRQRLRGCGAICLEEALLATGFAPALPAQYRVFERLDQLSRGVRRDSCASLDLAYVAAGRLSAFWEVDLKPWDVAAGRLLIEESGGLFTDLRGDAIEEWPFSGDYLGANPALHRVLVRELQTLAASGHTPDVRKRE